MKWMKWKDRTKFRNKYINPFIEFDIIEQTIPGKPNSSKQQYLLTQKGMVFLLLLEGKE